MNRGNNQVKKIFSFTVSLLITVCFLTTAVSAATDYPLDIPYNTYIYDSNSEPISIPAAFETENVANIGFNDLSDIFALEDGTLFICDSGNDRIVITDTDFAAQTVIDRFSLNGTEYTLSKPKGVWADDTRLYIADTQNGRIAAFERNGTAVKCRAVFERPQVSVLSDDYEYLPTRLTVDMTGKMYVLCKGINQGILCLDENGKFLSFTGAPGVEPNFIEALWRKVATKEQLSRMDSYVPTEYSAITMDKNGFLYVVSQTSNKVPVGKLNSDGDNILAAPFDDYGDSLYLKNEVYKPYFTDVALYNSGKIGEDIYFVLDSKQGRIYAYTEDGILLYAFGVNGTQKGTFYSASAIDFIPEREGKPAQLVVTDAFKNTVTVLRETDFSKSVRKALSLYNDGDYKSAKTAWEGVKKTASGYLPADVSLAKMELYSKDYAAALKRLKVIRRYSLYNDAFSKTRDDFIRAYFPYLLAAAAAAAAVFAAAKRIVSRKALFGRLRNSELARGFKYGTYVMLHPFDGFWDLKHEKKGNVKSATLMAVMFFVFYAMNIQFGGYIATGHVQGDVNVIYGVFMMLLPLAFYVISNWCFTTLMNGKGTMKDIYIATCYALKPYVVFALPMLLLSNIVTVDELPFYTFFNTVIMLWVLFLLFAGLMMTHDYTPKKTVLTVILILVGICLIVFIILLVISIIQNIYQFGYNTYKEISFRSY